MRIAIIAPPWLPVPPEGYGGTEGVLDTLARGLVTAGHDVLLCATGDSTCTVPLVPTLERAAGTVSTGAATELCHVVKAYEAVQDWGADVVHDHTLVGPVYAGRFRIPVVTTNHGPFGSELGPYYAAISDSVAVVAISHHQASLAGSTRVAAVIHHGIDVDSFPLGDGDGGYALFLGRMNPDKGVHTAARLAREAGIPLKIAAKLREPAERAYFEREVEPLLGDGIEYVGEVGGTAKLDLLAGARCLLNPLAWDEPFGLVMVEALATGTPVVATARGSVPELIDDGTTGFVRADASELVECLGRVGEIDRSLCRKVAAERFSAERMVADHVALYAEMIERSRPPRAA